MIKCSSFSPTCTVVGIDTICWHNFPHIREVLQNEFRHDFQKSPREISSGTVFTVFTCITAFNTVITVRAQISRGPFRKSYRNSFCKTSLLFCKSASKSIIQKEKQKHQLLPFLIIPAVSFLKHGVSAGLPQPFSSSNRYPARTHSETKSSISGIYAIRHVSIFKERTAQPLIFSFRKK